MDCCYHQTPIGILCLLTHEDSVWQITLLDHENLTLTAQEAPPSPVISRLVKRLHDYFRGNQVSFRDIPLAPRGTRFQRRVWQQLQSIPYGSPRTYGQLAQAIDQPKACRAVGAAVGANPWMIVCPCHRVLGAQARLTGYHWGVNIKQQLLQLEKIPYRPTQ